jgi:2-oxoglutarate/2-oxoacid ferredoxin oxidoreductase subunit alpha
VEAIGGTAKDKGKNIYTLGLLAKIFDLNVSKLTQLISERFRGKDESILNNALAAFNAGYAHSVGNLLETFKFTDPTQRKTHQVVMSGNEALAYGIIAAGVRFGAGYPITPWSDIMELLRRELPKYGGTFVQCEDEIASISMALGASYAGRVAVTGSSGPGISLKTEALGWAVMAEMPLVVIDVQRGGPSTGMPTNVEQSDLNIAVFGGHGDCPRVVLAPSSVEDCFYTAIEAVNITMFRSSFSQIKELPPGSKLLKNLIWRLWSRTSHRTYPRCKSINLTTSVPQILSLLGLSLEHAF